MYVLIVDVHAAFLLFLSFSACQRKKIEFLYEFDMMNVCFVDFAGRVVFLGKGDDAQQPSESEFKGVGYY
jgi:hypothetical protein